jgi:tRNA nucleotidyltransferase/poly(A) polymerase
MFNKIKDIISPVYMVGGCLRDKLLGFPPKDYDFATPLLPDEIEARIKASGKKAYIVGKRFGTIGVKIDGQMVEITTFRNEKYEKGNRKPSVEYVQDITADLSRRDFTINAMAMRDEKIIDPFGGRLDLLSKIIKCVSDPKLRFKEDPLRMLRAARFAAQLNFNIDYFLESTAGNMAYKILEISKERWVMELDKILMTDKPSVGLDFIMRTRLMNFILPEMSLQYHYDQDSPHHCFDLWEHTKIVVDSCDKDINLRWAALLHDIAKPFVRTKNKKGYSNYILHDYLGSEIVKKTAEYLRWSNERTEKVSGIVFNHLIESNPLKKYDNMAKQPSSALTPERTK